MSHAHRCPDCRREDRCPAPDAECALGTPLLCETCARARRDVRVKAAPLKLEPGGRP